MANYGAYLGKLAKKSRAPKRIIDTTDLTDFLSSLEVGVSPSIHINGPSYAMALVSVDFGQPIVQARLSPEETSELHARMKVVAKSILSGRDVNIRINHDGPNGVYWASIG